MKRKLLLPILLVLLISSSMAAVTSVDKVQYDSNSDFFNGQSILIGYVSDFSTDKIDVYLSKDELSRQTGKNVKSDLQLDVTSQNSYLQYGTQDIGLRPFYTFKAVKHVSNSESAAIQWGNKNCRGPVDFITKRGALTFTGFKYSTWCVIPNELKGRVASLKNPSTIYKTDWQLSSSGKRTQTVTVSNQNQKSTVKLGDHAVITNIGSLTTGASKPSISNVYAVHDNDFQNSWRIIYRRKYNNWNDFITNSYVNSLKRWASGETTKSNLENKANDKLNDAIQPAYNADIYGAEPEDTSFESGTFRYDTLNELVFPRFNIYVDAGPNGYITVEKPVGKARIINTNGAEFGEFDSGRISDTVRNVGDNQGSFTAGVRSCSNGFQFDGIEKDAVVDRGDTHKFSFLVSASSNLDQKRVEGSCRIQVTNSEAQSVSESVDVAVKQQPECTKGGEVVRIEDGSEVIKVCTDGFNLKNQAGDAVCGSNEEARLIGTTNGKKNYECRSTKTGGGDNGGDTGGNTGGGDCVIFSIGEGSILVPEYKLINPFCGEQSILDQVVTVFHWFFAVVIGSGLAYVLYYSARWIDGERSIRGSFKLKNRSVSRVKKGSAAIGFVAGLVGLLIGVVLGLSIPLWMEVLFLVLMIVLAWIIDKYTDFLGLFI